MSGRLPAWRRPPTGICIKVNCDISWQAHEWLGANYGWTKGIEYECVGDYTVPAYFYIRNPEVAMLFKLTWGGYQCSSMQ